MNTTIKKILNSTILLWIVGSLVITSLVMWALIDGRFPKYLFGVDNPKANGDFLTICFSIIGGGAVIYGLYLNNKRIKEQTRQNDIAANSSNDKRFGDAIGYLNSDNVGVAIGGVYALSQLAKEDKRYTPIVANIFLETLSECSVIDFCNRKDKMIVESIFSDTFDSQRVIFEGLEFKHIQISTCQNKVFRRCNFDTASVNTIIDSAFIDCSLDNSLFMNISDLSIISSGVWGCRFSNNCSELKSLLMNECNIISTKIGAMENINMLSIKRCTIQNYLHIVSPVINNTHIDVDSEVEKDITFATNTPLDKICFKYKGNNATILPYKEYNEFTKNCEL